MSDIEGRTPTSYLEDEAKSAKSKFRTPVKALTERVEQLDNRVLRSNLEKDLRDFNAMKFQDNSHIAGAYQTVIKLLMLFGHVEAHRKQCDSLRKTLEAYVRAREAYLNIDFPKDLVEQLKEGLIKLETVIVPKLSEEDRLMVQRVFRDSVTVIDDLIEK